MSPTSEQLGPYLEQVAEQAESAARAVAGVYEHLQRLQDTARSGNYEGTRAHHAEVFRSIHSALVHTGGVSKLLWPPRVVRRTREGETKESAAARQSFADQRGQALVRELGGDIVSFFRDRTLRDHLEHADERLDQLMMNPPSWWAEGNIGHLVVSPEARKEIISWFDPVTGDFIIHGDTVNLNELARKARVLAAFARERVAARR